MEKICIRFAGVDQNSGAIFVQFSSPEQVATIDQSTIHAFFPHQFESQEIDKLMPHISAMGRVALEQQQAVQFNHQFTQAQLDEYSQLIGTCRSVDVDASITVPQVEPPALYGLDGSANPNGQVDQICCIVLEILAEEGLIPGAIQ